MFCFRSGSEDYSDYLITPDNHSPKHSHKYMTQNNYYNHNISPAQYDDNAYQMSQNNIYNLNNHYEDYYTGNNNVMLQHSILDMDDNTIKIQTEIKNSHVNYDDSMHSHSDGENMKDNSNEKLHIRDQFAFLNKHIDVVDNINETSGPLNSLNNSLSNSESASSPIQTSSENNIVSSGISCGNVETSNSADSKSPIILSDKLNGNILVDTISENMDKLVVNDKQTVVDLAKSNIGKNFRYKTARKKSYDKVMDACSNLPNDDISYDKNNDVNQNVGFVYPKVSSIKSFGTNQYLGLSGNSLNNYESSISPDSVETTPVHGKKPQTKLTKKKRVKGGDWKNKGIYQALDNANTSDMESPNKIIKPDKRYYKDTDSFAKIGVKTIQSIFDQSKDKNDSKDDKQKISDEIDSADSDALQELMTQKNYYNKLENNNKKVVDDVPLMSFTPEHALPNLKPNNSVTISVKPKNIESVQPEKDFVYNDIGSDPNMELESKSTEIATGEKSLHNINKLSSVHKFPLKNREFRIGTAKRIPPPPDVIHIPLKDLNTDLHVKSNIAENASVIDKSSGSQISNRNFIDSCKMSSETQEQIETEINDIYPVLENIMNGTSLTSHSQADIDATLKLALSKLEMSMLSEGHTSYSKKSYSTSENYHPAHKMKTSYPKCESLNFAKDLIIEGNGDPDFGTPV